MTSGEKAVMAAMQYANGAGEGSGYWLNLKMMDGNSLRGPCCAPDSGIMRMEVFTEEDGVNYAEPVWVNLEHVLSVQIEW
jgi:hypothetical protein